MEITLQEFGWLALRLGAAFVLGGLVGLEREWQRRPAGLRTHILVAVGSGLFTSISVVAAGDTGDQGRAAAGVVTGIGFIGAGTIMHYGTGVRGLTTAASLWMVAAIGMACALDQLPAALLATFMSLFALVLMDWLEDNVLRKIAGQELTVIAARGVKVFDKVCQALTERQIEIISAHYSATSSGDTQKTSIRVRTTEDNEQMRALCGEIEALPGVRNVDLI
jgi:putative Mg2+ transporter-C (MgtC) family protein